MASTEVYCKPILNILEGYVELGLVNACHLKTVPGRQTDVKRKLWTAHVFTASDHAVSTYKPIS